MKLFLGLVLFFSGVAGLAWARSRTDKLRWIAGTNFEVPATLIIVGAIGMGLMLSIIGAAELRL